MLIQTLIQNPIVGIAIMISLIIAIAIHEACHAFAAIRLGDNTPKMQGRNTLNPIKHLDPLGTVMLLFVGVGWGKPVQYNPYNLKKPRRDGMLIALAGPASNIVLAIAIAIFIGLMNILGIGLVTNNAFLLVASYLIYINVVLAVFNMIPIEPLDGFKVVKGLLPRKYVPQWDETARYGLIILVLFLVTGMIDRIVYPVTQLINQLLLILTGLRL